MNEELKNEKEWKISSYFYSVYPCVLVKRFCGATIKFAFQFQTSRLQHRNKDEFLQKDRSVIPFLEFTKKYVGYESLQTWNPY